MPRISGEKLARVSTWKPRPPTAIACAGQRYVNVEFLGVNHGFFCDARSDYDAGASHQAWALTLAFLDRWLRAA